MMLAVPHKKDDRPRPQVNNITTTLPGIPVGGVNSSFCEGCKYPGLQPGYSNFFSAPHRLTLKHPLRATVEEDQTGVRQIKREGVGPPSLRLTVVVGVW
jgi:hypothetical protein